MEVEEYKFVWEPRGKNPVDDKYEDMVRARALGRIQLDYIPEGIPEDKRSVRIWLFAFLMGYCTHRDDSVIFLKQKQITSEMRFVTYGWNPYKFSETIYIDNNARRQYPWLYEMLKAMHARGTKSAHHTKSIDVHDQGMKNYDADTVGRDEIERDNRWLSTRPPEDRTPALCREYVDRNPLNISDVPREILTEDLCIFALIKSRASVWPRIPATLRSSKVWMVAFGMASKFKNVIPTPVKDEYPWVFELIDRIHVKSSMERSEKKNREEYERNFIENQLPRIEAEERRLSEYWDDWHSRGY